MELNVTLKLVVKSSDYFIFKCREATLVPREACFRHIIEIFVCVSVCVCFHIWNSIYYGNSLYFHFSVNLRSPIKFNLNRNSLYFHLCVFLCSSASTLFTINVTQSSSIYSTNKVFGVVMKVSGGGRGEGQVAI